MIKDWSSPRWLSIKYRTFPHFYCIFKVYGISILYNIYHYIYTYHNELQWSDVLHKLFTLITKVCSLNKITVLLQDWGLCWHLIMHIISKEQITTSWQENKSYLWFRPVINIIPDLHLINYVDLINNLILHINFKLRHYLRHCFGLLFFVCALV